MPNDRCRLGSDDAHAHKTEAMYRRYAIADESMLREGVSSAELTKRIIREVVGRDGIEPPTPGFSVDPAGPDHVPSSSDIVDNQGNG